MKRVAINGFGRIGRLTFKALLKNKDIEVVAINDLTDNKTLAHLLKYDSVHGKFDGTIDSDEEYLIINGVKINAYAERDPAKLPWKELGVDVVVECTGVFRKRELLNKHLDAGADKVVLSVPSAKPDDVDATIVLGVNDDTLKPEHKLISNASCTTNCLAPISKVLNDNFGIEHGSVSYTHLTLPTKA